MDDGARRPPARHDLVWLAPSWQELLGSPLPPGAASRLADWFARGRPAVGCRRDPAGPPGVALGVSLPGPAPRWRVGFTVAARAVAGRRAPPSLAEAIPSAPPPWHGPLAELDRSAGALGLAVSVYGSLAWQHVTGEAYVDHRSDVDLLLRPRTRAQLDGALALLARWDGRDGLRVDGEIVVGDERAVAGRGPASGRPRVLVKTGTSVALEPREDLLGGLGAEAA